MRHEALFALALCACWREQTRIQTPPTVVKAVEYHPPPSRDPRPRPEAAEVGYWSGARFVPATTIPLVPATQYGWRIRLPCVTTVPFKETLALPAPTTWGPSDPHVEISADSSVAVTHAEAPCDAGWIEHFWLVDGNDPPGDYDVTVEIDGWATVRLRATFAPP